ncbi:hypothetical protein [Ectopseudomonas mendocina]|uniref:Transmembrane protein n=1 Tax=Ectopseudomonas mendocina S5.2 TaxID=1225174 RepID=A0ABM5W3A9_ECTME|nr:hypothetical protein [Pseudomonas mendocina]ALN21745.1 hypothetical protein DW68_024005 [Pseudomonas mendocina S5.2]KER98193.1 hypothetical protein HN51_25720 [Pseudomonas mendocina]
MVESLKTECLLVRVKVPLVAFAMSLVGLVVALVLRPDGILLAVATGAFVLLFAFLASMAAAASLKACSSTNGPGSSARRKFALGVFWAWLALIMFTVCYNPALAASTVGGFVVDTVLGGALLWCMALSGIAGYEAFQLTRAGQPEEAATVAVPSDDPELVSQRARVASNVSLEQGQQNERHDG